MNKESTYKALALYRKMGYLDLGIFCKTWPTIKGFEVLQSITAMNFNTYLVKLHKLIIDNTYFLSF